VFTNSEGIESFLSQSEYNKFLNKNKELKKALGKNGENLKNGVPFELKDLSSEANPKGDKRIAFERNQDEIDSAISRILAPPAKGKAATVPSEEAAKIKEFEKSITRARGEISEPIRIMMGEYLDSNINFFKSMSKAGSLLAKAKVESNLLEQDDGALFSKKEVKGWKKISKSESVGLGGMYVNPELYSVMYGENNTFTNSSKMVSWLIGFNSLTKAGLTIFKMDSQSRNFTGAIWNLISTGHIPSWGNLVAASKTSIQDFTTAEKAATLMSTPTAAVHVAGSIYMKMRKNKFEDSREQFKKDYLEAVEQGLIEDSAIAGVIEAEANKMYDETVGGNLIQKMESGARKATQNAIKTFSKPYQATDAIFKIIQYKKEKSQYDSVYRKAKGQPLNVPFEQTSIEYQNFIKEKASKATREEQPTYSKSSAAMKSLSRSPIVGSFVMFQSQMIKTRISLIRNIYEMGSEIQQLKESGNQEAAKELRKLQIKKTAGLTVAMGLGTLLKYSAKAMLAMGLISYAFDDDDEKAFDMVLPSYSTNSNIVAYGGKFDGDVDVVDWSFLNPNSMLDKVVSAIYKEEYGYEKGAIGEIIKPFVGAEVGTEAIFEAIANQDAYGRQITESYKFGGERFLDALVHASSVATKGLPENVRNVIRGIEGEERYGVRYSLAKEISNIAAGVKVKTRNVPTMLQNNIWGLKTAFKEIENDFKDELKSLPENASDADKQKITDEFNEKYVKHYYDKASDLYNAFSKSSMGEEATMDYFSEYNGKKFLGDLAESIDSNEDFVGLTWEKEGYDWKSSTKRGSNKFDLKFEGNKFKGDKFKNLFSNR